MLLPYGKLSHKNKTLDVVMITTMNDLFLTEAGLQSKPQIKYDALKEFIKPRVISLPGR